MNNELTVYDRFLIACVPAAIADVQRGVKDYTLTNLFGPTRTGISNQEIVAALAKSYADELMKRRK